MKVGLSRKDKLEFTAATILAGMISNPNCSDALSNETLAHVAVNVALCLEKEINTRAV